MIYIYTRVYIYNCIISASYPLSYAHLCALTPPSRSHRSQFARSYLSSPYI